MKARTFTDWSSLIPHNCLSLLTKAILVCPSQSIFLFYLVFYLVVIKYHQSPRCSFRYLASMEICLTCLPFKSYNSVYNRNIPSKSKWMKQNFFHMAFDHINYFRKMPTNSHPVLIVKHIHKDHLGFWDKVISQK